LKADLDEWKSKNDKDKFDEKVQKLIDEHKEFVRDIQREHNEHLTKVISQYEKKISNITIMYKSERKDIEAEKLRIDERIRFKEQTEVNSMKEEIGELRRALQDCEKNLFKAMNTLKEKSLITTKLKETNSELQAEIERLKSAHKERALSSNHSRIETKQRGLQFETWEIDNPTIRPKRVGESRLEGSRS